MSVINALPYLHALGDGGPRSQTQMVVIHATDNTASADDEASYATHRSDETSAHFYVDDNAAYRALPVGNIAYGCYPIGNSRSVQLELVGRSNAISDATMRRAAPIVAEVCTQYDIPIRHVGPAELVAGAKGICGHGDVTAAWHQGDHTDPGLLYPWSTFISYVQAAAGGDMAGEADQAFATPYPGAATWINGRSWMALAVGNPLAALTTSMGVVLQKLGVEDTELQQLLAHAAAAAGPTDAQVAAQAEAIATKLVASNANGLTPADHAAIVADVKAALQQGAGH